MSDSMGRVRTNIPSRFRKRVRVKQRGIFPAAAKTRHLESQVIKNTSILTDSVSIADGVIQTFNIIYTHNENYRLGGTEFAAIFFETSAVTANIIPGGTNLTTGDYLIHGPMMVPPSLRGVGFISGNLTIDNDGNNLYYRTYVTNNSGGAETVVWYMQLRYITPGGSA